MCYAAAAGVFRTLKTRRKNKSRRNVQTITKLRSPPPPSRDSIIASSTHNTQPEICMGNIFCSARHRVVRGAIAIAKRMRVENIYIAYNLYRMSTVDECG